MKEKQPSLKDRLLLRNRTPEEKKKILNFAAVGVMVLGITTVLVGAAQQNNVRRQEDQIRNEFPNNPAVWRSLELERHIPQQKERADLIVVGGLAVLAAGFFTNIRLASDINEYSGEPTIQPTN